MLSDGRRLTMRRNLFIASIVGVCGAAAGAVFAVASLQVVDSLVEDRAWLVGFNAGLGAFAGASIGWLCAATDAQVGGRLSITIATIVVGFLAGTLVARPAFGSEPGGMQLLLAAIGAAIASLTLRVSSRWTRLADASPGKPRPGQFQFTLAALLSLLTLVSIGLALYVRGPVRRQHVAADIERSGGYVRSQAQAPYWVVDSLGDVSRGLFNTITEVETRIERPEDLARLEVFPTLRALHLSGGNLSDDQMNFVGGLTSLEELDLGGAQINDAALRHLQKLPRLRSLNLPGSITVAALAHLAALDHLESLSLNQIKINDDDFRHLTALPRLRVLRLWSSTVSDEALGHVGKLTSLEELRLERTDVTDAGLSRLRRLIRLKRLCLTGTGITDQGLKHLRAMTRLERLEITNTNVSGVGFAQLDGLGQLQDLCLDSSPITDAGCRFIGQFSNLKLLHLAGTCITDDGLGHLEALKQLHSLRLTSNPAITDTGILNLHSLFNLTNLDTAGTACTSWGLDRLSRIWNVERAEAGGPAAESR